MERATGTGSVARSNRFGSESRQLSGSLSGDALHCGSLAGASAARFLLLVNFRQNKILTYTNDFS